MIIRIAALLAISFSACAVEILRDRWGIPHVYAPTGAEAFFGVGYATAEDRLLQMDLFRRRGRGRLAEVLGARFVASDRRFRIAGMGRHCEEAAAAMPAEMREYLRGYAAGVNAWVRENPEKAARRMAPLGAGFEAWTPPDSVCAFMGVAELFDRLMDPGAGTMYAEFRRLAAELGEEEALARPGMMIDDAAAVVPESEMARNAAVYERLKSRPRTPGFWVRSLPEEMLRFSHAWAVGGTRSVTGKPLLQSDPQTPVNNPPLWYEFHVDAGRFNVRGIGFAGAPAMLIGFNTHIAWGATALGAGSSVTFIEKLSPDGRGYLFKGRAEPFERRLETILVKDGKPVEQEVLRTRHGFVFNALLGTPPPPGEAWVSHYRPIEERVSPLVGLFNMMAAYNWEQFREAMQWYYSPGIHVVYADREGNLGYQTLVNVPLTRRTPRMALEGWTGEDEVMGRIPLDEMPNMFNPAAGFVSHANNLPVGSWYPYDLGVGTGGTGHTSRSLRLVQLLDNQRLFSVESFESDVHRDDVHASVAAMWPVARGIMAGSPSGPVQALLEALKDWDLRFRADQPAYPAAAALGATAMLTYRRSGLGARLGGGDGGMSHLARLLAAQFPRGEGEVRDREVRNYLAAWIAAAAEEFARTGRQLAPAGGRSRIVHSMPYQANGPLGIGSLDRSLDLTSPPIIAPSGATIWSQPGNSYSQIVDLADPDNSRTLLPPGISEDPESPHRTDQIGLWIKGSTHPAPLSRHRVEEISVSRIELRIPSANRSPGQNPGPDR
jgi:penicillin amidase